MQKGNAVFGLVVLVKEIGSLDLEVLEESANGFLGPLHEVQVIVKIRTVTSTRLCATSWCIDCGGHSVGGVGYLGGLGVPMVGSR